MNDNSDCFYEVRPESNFVIIEPAKMYALGFKSLLHRNFCNSITVHNCDVTSVFKDLVNRHETDLILLNVPEAYNLYLVKRLVRKLKRHFTKARVIAYGYNYRQDIVEDMFALKVDGILQLDDLDADVTVVLKMVLNDIPNLSTRTLRYYHKEQITKNDKTINDMVTMAKVVNYDDDKYSFAG